MKNVIKRIVDIVISLCALFFGLPIFIITAIAIKLDSEGPVFYFQDRVGKDENLFKSFAGMCQFYKVEANTVARRVNVGVPISMALDDSGTHYFACA